MLFFWSAFLQGKNQTNIIFKVELVEIKKEMVWFREVYGYANKDISNGWKETGYEKTARVMHRQG